MTPPLVTANLRKKFGAHTALRGLTLEIPHGRIAGLLGRNGAGKTTLLNLACGLLLPTSGTCTTLGRPTVDLRSEELARIGVVLQEGRFLEWMTVAQQLEFSGSFYPRWDKAREVHLLDGLELDTSRKIGHLSPGDQQKLGLILGVCHHPELLLLDEPMSALDPIVRARLLTLLVDLVRDDDCTIIVSSHILADVEKIIDWVVCLDDGQLAVCAPFDEVLENHAEWMVSAPAGRLPEKFAEPFVLAQEGDARRARLLVRAGAAELAAFRARHGVEVATRPLNLDQLFPLLLQPRKTPA